MGTNSRRLAPGEWGEITFRERSGFAVAHVYYRDLAGKRRQMEMSGRTETAARRALVKRLKDKLVTPEGKTVRSTTTVRTLSTKWLAQVDRSDLATRTKDRYRDVVEHYVVPSMGQLRVDECKHSRLQQRIDAISDDVGPATARLCRTVLSGMFKFAMRDGALDANPALGLEVNSPRKPGPKALEDVGGFLARLRDDERARAATYVERKRPDLARRIDLADLVDFLAATGVRIGDALAVSWSDLNLAPEGDEAPTVTVRRTAIRPRGEGMRIQPHRKGEREGDALEVALPRWAVAMLLERQTSGRVVPTGEDLVFPSAWGTIRDPDNVRDQLRAACKRLGVEGVTPHTFRRTVGTAVARCMGAQAAADQLGHSSPEVTVRHYIERVRRADHRDVIEGMAPRGASS